MALKTLLKTDSHRLQYHFLDPVSVWLIAISDGSFANIPDLLSQLGHIILQTGKSDNAIIIPSAFYKSKRIVRSVLGAESYAFADCLNFSFAIKDELQRMF